MEFEAYPVPRFYGAAGHHLMAFIKYLNPKTAVDTAQGFTAYT